MSSTWLTRQRAVFFCTFQLQNRLFDNKFLVIFDIYAMRQTVAEIAGNLPTRKVVDG